MSPSEQHYKLEIRIFREYSPFIRLTIFDSKYYIHCSKNNRSVSLSLPKDIYIIRLEAGEQIKDITIVLNEDKRYFLHNEATSEADGYTLITPPKLYSSVPLHSHDNDLIYRSSHEYYTNPAVEYSTKNTANGHPGAGSSLFIMLRYLSIEDYRELSSDLRTPFWTDFFVENMKGDFVMRFQARHHEANIAVNHDVGYAIFNAELKPGLYFLNYMAKTHTRQIPIYVYAGWHTQVFLLIGKQPVFRSLRILFSRSRAFDPFYRHLKLVDILLGKLQDNDLSLTEGMIEQAARDKFESPILGMLCAYVYLKSKSTKNDTLFKTMVSNLRDQILDNNETSPDLRALEILAAKHFGNMSYSKAKIDEPPMFRAGFEAIKDASVEAPNLIQQGSYNDFISVNAYYDSPFNTFKPVKSLVEQSTVFRGKSKYTQVIMGRKLSSDMQIKSFLGPISFEGYVGNASDQSRGYTWVENSIIDLLKLNAQMNIADLSKELNLSANTITRIIQARKVEFSKIR